MSDAQGDFDGDGRRDLPPRSFAGPDSAQLAQAAPQVSQRMARTRRRDTKPEIQLRRVLHARGLRFRVDRPIPGASRRRADVVFGASRVAVFVDGCFWHGCPEHGTWPSKNNKFWREKIETNRSRDRDTDQLLSEAGWVVIRVWEHEDASAAADRIEQAVRARREERSKP
jgi:DNA mismatch endonuclease, patch repair protein